MDTAPTTTSRARRSLADDIVNLKGELQAAHAAHAGKVAELEKKLASAENMQKHYAEGARKAESELEQIASLCDALDGAPPRRKEVTNRYGSSDMVELSAITRLSAYLAQRK